MNGSSNHSCTIRYSSLNLQAANTCGVRSPRVAVHLHLHYVELLDELLRDIAHIPGKFDLFVTTTRSATSLSEQIHAWFPSAIVWQTENRGRDIGPFIDAIERHNLDQYELVLKVHGKRSVNTEGYMEAVQALFGPEVRTGDDWRRGLIRPLLASSWRVAAIFNAFAADVALGMVGAARFVCQVPDSHGSAYALL
jgi:lipopolysaccharide biosynthesis protein